MEIFSLRMRGRMCRIIAVCRSDALARERPKPPLPKGRWPAGPEGFVARRATAAFGGQSPSRLRRQLPLGKGAMSILSTAQ